MPRCARCKDLLGRPLWCDDCAAFWRRVEALSARVNGKKSATLRKRGPKPKLQYSLMPVGKTTPEGQR